MWDGSFLYSLFNALAVLTVTLYNLLQYKKKRLILGGVSHSLISYFQEKETCGLGKILGNVTFWVVVETVIITAAQYYSAAFLNTPFGNIFDSGANYFGLVFFAPLLVVVFCAVLKIDALDQLDLITPAYPLGLTISKVACYFAGCCRGVEWEKGFYNPVSQRMEFPAQLLEAGVAFLIFIVLLIFKNKFSKGTVFPAYLIIYSATRFFTEFTRCEPNVFMGLKIYQILCLVGIVVGVAEYFIVRAFRDNRN